MYKKKSKIIRTKEEIILDAARSRFASFGYSKVTMDEIAEDVGIVKASLYYYFPTKNDIYRAIIQREQSKFVHEIKNLLTKRITATQKLYAYFQLRYEYSNQIFSLSWHNRHLWPSIKPVFKDLFNNLSKQEHIFLTNIFQQGKNTKEFKIHSPKKIARLIYNVIQGLRIRIFYSNSDIPGQKPPHDEFENELNLFIELVIKGLLCDPEL